MHKTVSCNTNIMTFGIPLSMMAMLIILTLTSWFSANPGPLSIGITLDLAFTIPLTYMLLIQKRSIPKITVIPILLSGLIIAGWVLPAAHQSLLNLLKLWLIPVAEAGVLIFLIFKVIAIYRAFHLKRDAAFDFYTALRSAVQGILPGRINTLLALEIAIIYYGFVDWKKRELKDHEFSYHKGNSHTVILWTIIFLILTETFVLHLLISGWNNTVAWIASGLSLYTGLQVFGMIRSFSKRPIAIENGKLKLRFGIMAESAIELDDISSVELSSKDITQNELAVNLSPLGNMGDHNIIIHLKSENTLYGLYGVSKKFKTIALPVDEKQKFIETLSAAAKQHHLSIQL